MNDWDDDTIVIGGDSKHEDDPGFDRRKKSAPSSEDPPAEVPAEPTAAETIAETIELGAPAEDTAEPAEQTAAIIIDEADDASLNDANINNADDNGEETTDADAGEEIAELMGQNKAARSEKIAADIAPAASVSEPDTGHFERRFLVTSSPHLHSGESTSVIMQDVLIALSPAAAVAAVYFGWRALMLIAVCIASCVFFEYSSRRVMKRRNTISDFSAAVTGLLLAFCLPPELNPVYAVLGSAVAIIVVKQMFGGIGMNFANPAITARIVLVLSFGIPMTTFAPPFFYLGRISTDAVSTATPLKALTGAAVDMPGYLELLLGNYAGSLGETCAIALLLGCGYLLLRRVITWEIPVSFMGTVMVMALVFGQNPIFHLLTGGILLGAIFMATDYTTSPVNKWGKIVFGAGCGLLTMIIRLFAHMPEGVSFAILLMNILTPHIERLTAPKPFGEERKAV